MKVQGLKIFQIKEWKDKSLFTNQTGQTFEVPANQKIVCKDGDDIVNLTLVTPVPVSNLKVGDPVSIELIQFSKTAFAVNVKGRLV